MELQGVEFASELSTQLLNHSKELEALFTKLRTMLKDESVADGKFSIQFAKIDLKNKWFEEAKARWFLNIFYIFKLVHFQSNLPRTPRMA